MATKHKIGQLVILAIAIGSVDGAGAGEAPSSDQSVIDRLLQALTEDSTSGFYSGNELHSLAQNNRNAFLGYVAGVHDARKHQMAFCVPDRATTGQIAEVAKQYIDRNPARRHWQGQALVDAALSEAWPCPSRR